MKPNGIALCPMLVRAMVGLVAFCSMDFSVEAANQKPHNADGQPLPESSKKTDDIKTTGEKPLPKFSQIEKAATEHFAKLPNYQPGGVITRPEAEGFFASLETLGWKPDNRREILAKVPPPGDFLVEQLRTHSGKKFMGRIATYPDALDRLDRLSRLAYGKRHVKGLVNGPGGDQWVKYITTDKRGIELSRSMARAKNGADFDKPTGRIYTVQMLLEQLKASHKRAKGETAPVPASGSPVSPKTRTRRTRYVR